MSLFLSGLPLWSAAILLVVAPTVAAIFGPVLMRRRVGLERLTSNNEIARFKFATVGVIYAVLLAFGVIVVWEKFRDAETAVLQEPETGIVQGLWLVLYSGAVLTVEFTFFFGTKNLPAQVMMTGILAVIVFMGLLVIVSIDYPLTGPVHVGEARFANGETLSLGRGQ